MVRKYRADDLAPGGIYWNRKTWELIDIPEEGDHLPAGEDVTYYHLPVPLVMAVGPLAGLAFVLFLPLAVPFVVLYAVGRLVARKMPWRRGGRAERPRVVR